MQLYIKKRAYERDFRLNKDPRILDHYIINNKRLNRFKVIPSIAEIKLLKNIKTDRINREKSSEFLAYKYKINCLITI
jgi:hypothetical protein